jgi:hypothetical protein
VPPQDYSQTPAPNDADIAANRWAHAYIEESYKNIPKDSSKIPPNQIIGTPEHTQAFIDAMPIPAEQKTAIWNGYYGSGSPSDYQKVVDGASLSADQKTLLWHLKYYPSQLQTLDPVQPGMQITAKPGMDTTYSGALKGTVSYLLGK